MFHPSTELVNAGLQVMLYGLTGVFVVLITFYILTKAMVSIFTKLEFKRNARLEKKGEVK